jgi:iron complex transport system substrate-binding protein
VEPEVIVLALRATDAAGAERALADTRLPGWFDDLQAVRGGGFFAVDGHGLFSRPGPRVIEGVAVLAELLEPELFADSGPVEAWRPLAPVGLAQGRRADRQDG